ncbi:MAG: alpha/beta hydrolase, partial [Alphaproteobacteria bacterium]|nr:alpha/beta hydrolase [Alphaproteobacteria bacterium]
DQQWRQLVGRSIRWTDDGWVVPTTDPAIRMVFSQPITADVDLWPLWDAVTHPTLILRGADSDILPAATAERMAAATKGRTRVALVEFPGVGHAPALVAPDQITAVVQWLAREG